MTVVSQTRHDASQSIQLAKQPSVKQALLKVWGTPPAKTF